MVYLYLKDMKTLGDKLKALRTTKKWSQEDIAHELEISLPAYSKIERGITDISLGRLTQIAKLFNLTVIELLSYGEKTASSTVQKQLETKDKEIMALQKRIIELLDKKKK
ncbi:MAG: helix-turn-helix protein [Chitinophagaceae bacterium]|nr:helix-turn-helix protein [Chitinophagaceae bacterium]